MFATLMRLYDGGKGPLMEGQLADAVIKGWITEAQKQEILASK